MAPRLTGIGYVKALPALIKSREEERLYKVYMTDAMNAAFGLGVRFADIINGNTNKPPPDPVKCRERIMNKLSS